ncbi:MAG: hypothetical protein GWN01_16050 [Nitrosopumilaceae archaeon]|nr:hypothetical protein [Nitrosopumilaceae archaeon]NIU02350.1 hypothetical protein [Nitrosopumilaceae archaeon]NIU88807.1 hypothetical protein [Nitrosopumilaceae archaeon]NIV66932.1 hypothetical protein [Nitrosopumilaceae archaeon]NIX62951.1 hypothetical protein [Nitrosopumilaceae archaeon]
MLKINGISVKYQIRGGTILDHSYNNKPSIVFNLRGFENQPVANNLDPYYFEIWLPHELIDTEPKNTFKILLDGQSTAGGQAFQYEDPRWIGISYDKGIHTLEIIGSQKVISPEPEPQKAIPAPFVDPDKDPQHYIDRYNNESNYREWFDKNYPQYNSIYEAVGLPESDPKEKLPEWVRNIFVWYAENRISEDELLGAIEFLVEQDIIQIEK